MLSNRLINCIQLEILLLMILSTIGAGTVVIKDIPDNAVVVGNPGRIIKQNQ